MNLARAFAASAESHRDKVALFWGEAEFTYATLLRQSYSVGSWLQQHRVRPGDRVGLWLKNRPEFVPAMFGILNAGAVVVPINNFLKPDEVGFILADAGIDCLIADEELAAHLPALEALRPQLALLKVEDFPSAPARPASSSAAETDLAVIIYTSGTTGRPKGAMLSHGNLLHNVESCRRVLETVQADRFAVLLPLFHSYMFTVGLLLPLLVGGSMVLVKSLHSQHRVIEEICRREATILPAIPQFYRALASAKLPVKLPLRLCISGAAPLPSSVLRDFETNHGIPLIEGYGLSEASPVVTKNPIRGVRKPGSIGLPIPNVEVTVQDESGCILSPGEVGEICVRGGNVMMGYWQQPAETAATIRDGWLLTGDLGYRDTEGYFFITDRKKDMLLVNGINVYPREIEEVLNHFPGVKESAVVGMPDARRGEQPVVFVSALEGESIDERAALQFLRSKLAGYKVPRRLTVLPNLPRNATGKVLKTALRDLAKAIPPAGEA